MSFQIRNVCVIFIFYIFVLEAVHYARGQCESHQTLTFSRWSGVSPERAAPVFVYSASGDEASLTGACLARCRELPDCVAVAVVYTAATCHGIADTKETKLQMDNDVAYFRKVCLTLPDNCHSRWWVVESTPGYYLNSESTNLKVILNTTVRECYQAVLAPYGDQSYRSAQWVEPDSPMDSFTISDTTVGNCVLSTENKFTEPESYRVSNYYTFYIENECGHDYPKKIDRCSYEEYYNQTIKHVDFTVNNYTKNECKTACEQEEHFVCRGFTWTKKGERRSRETRVARGLCDLHSEDLVTAGSWLLRRIGAATYYRRVTCLNISVECEETELVVTYRPRSAFRGRVYVPGHGERCSARASAPNAHVRLALPLRGDCEVNFAYAITNGPNGVVNRTMAYVMLMIQNNPIIQTAGDRWVRVGCSPGASSRRFTKVDATVSVQDSSRPSLASESSAEAGASPGASAVYGAGAPLSLYVVRAHDSPPAPQAAVSLGEPLELRIDTTDENEIEAYHLVASSRLGDSSVLLLDSNGCPTGQVDFPAFSRWTQGGTQRLSAKFKAFRFPSSHVVRFSLMVRFCERICPPVKCGKLGRITRGTNTTFEWDATRQTEVADVRQEEPASERVVAQGVSGCVGGGGAGEGRVPLEVDITVGAGDVISADNLVHADHRAAAPEEVSAGASPVVCVHELILVALALAWLAVQLLLLLACCVLVKRYRNLAEMNMQKDYHSFDNVGFDTVSTHRRVHWPDQNIDILHAT